MSLKERAAAAEAVGSLLVVSPKEDAQVRQVWDRLRAKAFYTAEGCAHCPARFGVPSGQARLEWVARHFPGCNVPLLQATEELVVLKVIRWFTLRGLDPFDELPLVAARLAEELDGIGHHPPG